MYFAVRHETRYRYDVPVSLGPHTLRLTPQPDGIQLHRHAIHATPQPVAQRALWDAHGNLVTELQFVGSCQELQIVSEFELDTLQPRQPMLQLRLPLARDFHLPGELYGLGSAAPSVRDFAADIANQVSHDVLGFLDRLAYVLFSTFERGVRTSGNAHTAADTLASRSGACRDLTVLFMEACRSQGIASRFVSGYQASAQTPDNQSYLHAWAEVHVPGVGFFGWDPMHGVRVGEGHVKLCAAPEQLATMPVEGGFSFAGTTVRSTLDHSLRVAAR